MNRITVFAATAVVGLGAAVFSGVRVSAATTPAPAASQLNSDIQAGQSGPSATANDEDTAAEFNVDDGQVNDVQEETDQSGDQETADSSTGQSGGQDGSATGTDTGSQGDSGSSGTGADDSNGGGAGSQG
jgi:hypothetical protein